MARSEHTPLPEIEESSTFLARGAPTVAERIAASFPEYARQIKGDPVLAKGRPLLQEHALAVHAVLDGALAAADVSLDEAFTRMSDRIAEVSRLRSLASTLGIVSTSAVAVALVTPDVVSLLANIAALLSGVTTVVSAHRVGADPRQAVDALARIGELRAKAAHLRMRLQVLKAKDLPVGPLDALRRDVEALIRESTREWDNARAPVLAPERVAAALAATADTPAAGS